MSGGVLYLREVPLRQVSLWRRVLAKIGIPTIVYWDKEHFTAPQPIYVTWYKLHRIYFLDYPHGFKGYLQCPKCLEMIVKVIKKKVDLSVVDKKN